MTHPLRPNEVRARLIDKPWAAVTVERLGRETLSVVAGSFAVAKGDVQWSQLPARFAVVGDDKRIDPTPGRAFFISTETFDPYHLLMEHGREAVLEFDHDVAD